MQYNQKITWQETPGSPGSQEPCDRLIIPVQAQAGPIQLIGTLRVCKGPATLVDLIPAAREMADRLVEQMTASLEAQTHKVSCCAACSACCEYLIPLSPPEALALWQDLLALPGPKREQLVTRFLNLMKRMEQNPIPPLNGLDKNQLLETLSDWYMSLDSACPLLEKDLCSVYEQRPIACRECLSILPPEYCKNPVAAIGQRVQAPFSVAESLYETTGILLGQPPESVILAALPNWIETQSEAYERLFPAVDLARCLTGSLHRRAHHAQQRIDERAKNLLAAAGV